MIGSLADDFKIWLGTPLRFEAFSQLVLLQRLWEVWHTIDLLALLAKGRTLTAAEVITLEKKLESRGKE